MSDPRPSEAPASPPTAPQGRSAAGARLWRLATSPYLLLTLTALFWSGNFITGRAIRGEIPPVTLNFLRWVLAGAILAPFALAGLWRHRAVLRAHWPVLLVLSVTGISAFNSFVYTAVTATTALNAVLFIAITPLLIALLARLVLGDRLSVFQSAGLMVSMTGAVYVIARGDLEVLLQVQFNQGDLWMMAAVVSWSIYSLALKYRPSDLPPLTLLMSTVAVGIVVLAPVAAWELQGAVTLPEPTLPVLAAVLYTGIFPSVLAYIFYNYGVQQVGPGRAGTFIHFMPVFGAILSVLLLGETVAAYHVVGASLVFAGLIMGNLSGRRLPWRRGRR